MLRYAGPWSGLEFGTAALHLQKALRLPAQVFLNRLEHKLAEPGDSSGKRIAGPALVSRGKPPPAVSAVAVSSAVNSVC